MPVTSAQRTEQEVARAEAREQPVDNADAVEKGAAVPVEGASRTVGVRENTRSGQFLTAEKLATMSGAEIRAVAADRGYDDLGVGGQKSLARRFQVHQNNQLERDPGSLEMEPPKVEPALRPSETGPISAEEQALNAEGKSADARIPLAEREEPKS